MVRVISLKMVQIWVLMLLLIGVMRLAASNGTPLSIQQNTRSDCASNKTAIWDRQQHLTLALVPDGFCVVSSVWSPDGETLAYTQFRAQSEALGMAPPELMISTPLQDDARRIHDGQAAFGMRFRFFETRIQWSPDGQWILYTVRPGSNDLNLWVIRADGSATYNYTHFIKHEPAVFFWSADSQYVYLRMVEYDARTQAVHLTKLPLAPNPEPVESALVPFNNTVWVYPSRRGGEMLAFADGALWLVNLDSGAAQHLTATANWSYVGDIDAMWSADGERLALLGTDHNGVALLQIVRRDATDLREYTIVADSDTNRDWYITDFNWPTSLRLASPNWSGFTCNIHLQSRELTCVSGYDARRYIMRPTH